MDCSDGLKVNLTLRPIAYMDKIDVVLLKYGNGFIAFLYFCLCSHLTNSSSILISKY